MPIGFVEDGEFDMQVERWAFFKEKFDSLCCVGLVIGMIVVMMWADAHSSDKFLAWLFQSATTVLGTYLGIVKPWQRNGNSNGNNGGNGNGKTTASSVSNSSGVVTNNPTS